MDPSFKSHLILSCLEYCWQQGKTPFVAVVEGGRSDYPEGYARGGLVLFNVSSDAVRDLRVEKDDVSFSARFNGVAREVVLLTEEIAWVGSPTDGCGLEFAVDLSPDASEDEGEHETQPAGKEKSAAPAEKRRPGRPKFKLL